MSDEPPRAVPPESSGNVAVSTLLELLADDVDVRTDPTALAPSAGRVSKDAEDGTIYLGDGSAWLDATHDVGVDLAALPGLTVVSSADDLPDASGGVRTLADGQAYLFTSFVTDTATLRLGDPSPLLGWHGSQGGYIHTGGGTCIKTDGEPFMARNVYFHAPGGTVFDLTADNSTEMLVESCAFSDAAGLGNIASLGSCTGYRVPTWKGSNFEDFDAGLTFDGNPEKIFVWGSPLRNVTASNVTIFTLAGTATCQIVDFADNYIKDVQSDTEIWRVENGGEPTEVFQYRGTLHDTSFDPANAIVGPNASPQEEPFWVSGSHPVRDSSVTGELSLDVSSAVTTISSANQWTKLAGSTALGNETERVSMPSDGTLQYNGTKDVNVHLSGAATIEASNGDVLAVAIVKEGTVEPTSISKGVASGGGSPVSVPVAGVEDLQTGEQIELYVRNESAANDITTIEYNMAFFA